MSIEKRVWGRNLIIIGIIFIITFVVGFFGVQFFTKTGIFRIPGVVYYDESLTEEEKNLLAEVFTEEVDLDKDVYISARTETEMPEFTDGEFLSNISVAVADYYNVRTDISEYTEEEYEIIDFDKLDFKKKLLTIDGKYYLDTFNSGAYFRIIKFESEKYEEEIGPLIGDLFSVKTLKKDEVFTFAQTGVTALSRGMNSKLWAVGDAAYFAEKIKDYLSGFDLTHTSNESSFSEYASARNICSDGSFITTLTEIGLDIVELTGNHNRDCGDDAALETIGIYNEHGIKMVGGGATADEAAKPLEIDEKGTGITFLAYNLSTGGATYDDTPGANQYYEENARAEIANAKERGDFVIIDIQYYECNAYASEYEDPICDYADSSAGDQVGFFRELIDMGADLVVGTSAHQPQTFELYGEGAIYYGLGNLFFDQVWWPGTTRSLVLAHYFHDGKLLQTKVVPTVYDNDMQTRLMDEETTRWFLTRLIGARP